MHLTQKLTILTFLTAVILSIGIVFIVRYELEKHALEIANDKAEMFLHERLANNHYWNADLRPKVFKVFDENNFPADYFDPSWMSAAYANRIITKEFTQTPGFYDYYYKNAAVNARSPENEANQYEQDFHAKLVADPSLQEWAGVKTLEGQPYFVKMLRNVNFEEFCLRCHSTPENAPKDLVEIYGAERSFDKNSGELSSVLSIRIPLQKAYASVNRISNQLVGFLAGLILIVLFLQLYLTRKMVVNPVRFLIRKASRIAENNELVGETISIRSSRELIELSTAFSSMSTALAAERNSLEATVEQRTTELVEANQSLAEQILEVEQAEKTRIELEGQLRQKYKMEAVGVLAGGMAHNFNNNLSIILGNIELAQFKSSYPDEVKTYLDNSKTALLRSRDLIKQIMIYSRQEDYKKKLFNPSLVVEETLTLLHSTIPASIRLQHSISPEGFDATINADANQIQEALINLCTNAVHAMNEKGEIDVSLDTLELQGTDIPAQYQSQPGQYVRLSVKDTGCGIPAEVIEKIFDPFFTTKAVGQGTGMGLSTVRGIMERHDGIIKVHSELGEGTLFELYFPRGKSILPAEPENEITLEKGSEKILFIDDDEMLAEMGKAMLVKMGYQVTVHTDSLSALELVKKDPDYFDLVISDQMMPGLTGKDLAFRLREIRPNLPIVICTGYSSEVAEEELQQLSISAYCMKPLEMKEFSRTVRDCLDNAKD